MKYKIWFKPKVWYNEFKSPLRWKEYFSFYIKDFPVFAFRRYDWMNNECSSFVIAFLGITINIWDYKW